MLCTDIWRRKSLTVCSEAFVKPSTAFQAFDSPLSVYASHCVGGLACMN